MTQTELFSRKLTQKERVLKALSEANGEWVSGCYLNRGLGITQANARVKELKMEGYKIEESEHRDDYGFVFHRLVNSIEKQEPKEASINFAPSMA